MASMIEKKEKDGGLLDIGRVVVRSRRELCVCCLEKKFP